MYNFVSLSHKHDNPWYNNQDECTLCHMSVDALGNYLMTEAEIAAVEEGKTSETLGETIV